MNQNYCPNHPHEENHQVIHQKLQQMSRIQEQQINKNSIYNKSLLSHHEHKTQLYLKQQNNQYKNLVYQKDKQLQSLIQQLNHTKLSYQKIVNLRNEDQITINRLISQVQQKDLQITKLNGLIIKSSQSIDLNLKNELGNCQMKIGYLEQQLNQCKQRYEIDINKYFNETTSKNNQFIELKRRYNDLLEHKRRLEERIQTLEYQLQIINKKYELQKKQKSVRLQTVQRTQNESINNYKKQIQHLEQKIKQLQNQNQHLYLQSENNKHFKYEAQKQLMQKKRYLQEVQAKLQNIQHFYKNKQLQIFKNLDSIKSDHPKLNIKQNPQLVSPKTKISQRSFNQFNSPQTNIKDTYINFLSEKKYSDKKQQNIIEWIFEKFKDCVETGNQKKINSFILFIDYFKYMAQNQSNKIKNLLKFKIRPKCKPLHSIEERYHNKKQNNDVNKWVLQTFIFTLKKYQEQQYDQNKVVLFLFRILTILYRTKYPHKGAAVAIDADLKEHLNLKILQCLQSLVLKE